MTRQKRPARMRLPLIFPIVGWLFIVVGVLTTLLNLAVPETVVGMWITSLGILATGLLFLALHRNFYVEPQAERVEFRTLLGKKKMIEYRDIVDVREYEMKGRPYVQIVARDGVKLDLNPRQYDLSPVFDYLDMQRGSSDASW